MKQKWAVDLSLVARWRRAHVSYLFEFSARDQYGRLELFESRNNTLRKSSIEPPTQSWYEFRVHLSSTIRRLERARKLGGKTSTSLRFKMGLSSFEKRLLRGTLPPVIHTRRVC
jgi:hypothetical protein